MSKVYDCCMVYEEIDILELRMNILNDTIDHFVIVESGMTHSGLPKGHPVGDALQTERFAPFAEKVIYQYLDTLPGTNAWEREHAQRAAIGDVLRYFAEPDDWVIVGDADEIAHPNAVSVMRDAFTWENTTAVKLELGFYYYNFMHRVREGWAIGACKWKVQQDANKIRTCDFGVEPLVFDRAGWHLSYFLTPEDVVKKLNAFMHHADVAKDVPRDPIWIAERMMRGEDLFGRTIQIDRVPVSDSLPNFVLEHRAQYEALGWLERQTEATWQS